MTLPDLRIWWWQLLNQTICPGWKLLTKYDFQCLPPSYQTTYLDWYLSSITNNIHMSPSTCHTSASVIASTYHSFSNKWIIDWKVCFLFYCSLFNFLKVLLFISLGFWGLFLFLFFSSMFLCPLLLTLLINTSPKPYLIGFGWSSGWFGRQHH